jgi:hypothetical protein
MEDEINEKLMNSYTDTFSIGSLDRANERPKDNEMEDEINEKLMNSYTDTFFTFFCRFRRNGEI